MLNIIKFTSAMVLTIFSVSVFANPITGTTCGLPDDLPDTLGRTATLSGSAQCAYVNGNISNAEINDLYPATDWTKISELEGADGTLSIVDGLFSATSSAGWGFIPNSGTWTIDSSFWTMYDEAVITMHVGNADGNIDSAPDSWAWLMTADAATGTWSVDYTTCADCTAGGLSNIKLWGRGEGNVPEPGMVALLAIGLLGMVVTRRKMKV